MLYYSNAVWCVVAQNREPVASRAIQKSLSGLDTQELRKHMPLTDQTLYCRDCNEEFTFTVGEQEFYASRGLMNAPTRWPNCRAAHKAARNGGGGGGGSRSYRRDSNDRYSREPRQMYTATCASCGNEAQVPFQPREDRPVYCSNCYQPQSSGRTNDRRSRW